jgi:hypothetical protein
MVLLFRRRLGYPGYLLLAKMLSILNKKLISIPQIISGITNFPYGSLRFFPF